MSVATVRHHAVAATVFAASLLSSAAHARHIDVQRTSEAVRGPLEVEVKVAGRTTPLYLADNRPDRWYLEARQGAKYEIQVRNRTGRRVGFVLGVDGLNAIDGRLSNAASSEPMYVLEPYARATVKGWRKDLKNVSRFVFVDERRSYAERTGQGNGDLGWIRVTAFHEQPQRYGGEIRWRESDGSNDVHAKEEMRADEKAAPEAGRRQSNGMGSQGHDGGVAAPSVEANPGTGWGPNQKDRVRTVDFEPQRFAAAQVILRYEYPKALVALGILPWHPPVDRTWERDRGQYGFAQPPGR